MSKRPNNHPPVYVKPCSRMVGIYNMDVSFIIQRFSIIFVYHEIRLVSLHYSQKANKLSFYKHLFLQSHIQENTAICLLFVNNAG